MKNESNEDYNKQIDNELLKKELQEKYGGKFHTESDLPPEIEQDWLNNIEAFETQYQNAEQISVWDFLGKPAFRKIEDLTPEQITIELQRLYDIMDENNLVLDAICEVDDAEIYRFITEELFEHMIDNMRISGMNTCFIYEEFHPNAELDIHDAIDYFFRMSMGKMDNVGGEGYDLLYVDDEHFEDSNGKSLDSNYVVERLNHFLASFDSFEVVSKTFEPLIINEQETEATASFYVHYKGYLNEGRDSIHYEGEGCFKLHPSEYGGWSIYHITLPGLTWE